MADNYLEKRMADYRRDGGAAAPHRARRPAAPETSAAFVIAGLQGPGPDMVRSLRAAGGWKVAFCDSDTRQGMLLAQATGSRFYPADPSCPDAVSRAIADAKARWGALQRIIDCRTPPPPSASHQAHTTTL